jgi:hypothetical protein
VGPGGHPGASLIRSSAAGSNPEHRRFGSVTPGPNPDHTPKPSTTEEAACIEMLAGANYFGNFLVASRRSLRASIFMAA